jgi:hypothetical protein
VFIGLYNMDMGIKGKNMLDERSERVKKEAKGSAKYLKVSKKKEVEQWKRMLLAVALDEKSYEKESLVGNGVSHSKYGKPAMVLFFGESQKRGTDEAGTSRRGRARHNDNPAFSPFQQMLNAMVPNLFGIGDAFRFNCGIMALDSPTNVHVDKGHIGMALAFAVGNFTGGRLLVECGSAPVPAAPALAPVQVVLVVFV